MSKKQNIPVLSMDNKFLSYTTPAKARLLLKSGKVSVFKDDPFMVRMNGEIGDSIMVTKKSKSAFTGSLITNFTRYFAEESDVYVQNLTSGNISLEIKGQGDPIYISIPKTRKPLNLSQYAPFDLLKNSADFRKMASRNPKALRLMTEEQYLSYYEDLAHKNGTSMEDEMRHAQNLLENLMNKVKAPTDQLQREMEQKIAEKVELLNKPDDPHPRVIGLCAQADKDMGAQRIDASDFIDELESLADLLTPEDYEYVSTKGVWKKVKDFARDKLSELTSSDDEE